MLHLTPLVELALPLNLSWILVFLNANSFFSLGSPSLRYSKLEHELTLLDYLVSDLFNVPLKFLIVFLAYLPLKFNLDLLWFLNMRGGIDLDNFAALLLEL